MSGTAGVTENFRTIGLLLTPDRYDVGTADAVGTGISNDVIL